MHWHLVVILCILVLVIGITIGYQISDHFRQQEFESLLTKIEELEEEVVGLRNEIDTEPVTAAKFRIRTAQADPKRNARVVSARLRAKKYPKPEPRR